MEFALVRSSPQRFDCVLSIVVWCGVPSRHQHLKTQPLSLGFFRSSPNSARRLERRVVGDAAARGRGTEMQRLEILGWHARKNQSGRGAKTKATVVARITQQYAPLGTLLPQGSQRRRFARAVASVKLRDVWSNARRSLR